MKASIYRAELVQVDVGYHLLRISEANPSAEVSAARKTLEEGTKRELYSERYCAKDVWHVVVVEWGTEDRAHLEVYGHVRGVGWVGGHYLWPNAIIENKIRTQRFPNHWRSNA